MFYTIPDRELAADLCLQSIDKIILLRARMATAVALLEAGDSRRASQTLEAALAETDVGEMKVWQPGEEPF